MTPAYDWTRFDALRAWYGALGATSEYQTLARLRGKVADAREALERGRAVRMSVQQNRSRSCDALTPDQFVDLWEQGYRP